MTSAQQSQFGARMKARRQELEISQSDLAQALGIGQAFVSLIEAGKREPGLHTAMAIARALDCTIGALADE